MAAIAYCAKMLTQGNVKFSYLALLAATAAVAVVPAATAATAAAAVDVEAAADAVD